MIITAYSKAIRLLRFYLLIDIGVKFGAVFSFCVYIVCNVCICITM